MNEKWNGQDRQDASHLLLSCRMGLGYEVVGGQKLWVLAQEVSVLDLACHPEGHLE